MNTKVCMPFLCSCLLFYSTAFAIFLQVSLIKKEGEIVTHHISQDSGTLPVSPPAKKIVIAKKKLTPAKFIVPLQGVIAKENDQVVLECVIDGKSCSILC